MLIRAEAAAERERPRQEGRDALWRLFALGARSASAKPQAISESRCVVNPGGSVCNCLFLMAAHALWPLSYSRAQNRTAFFLNVTFLFFYPRPPPLTLRAVRPLKER